MALEQQNESPFSVAAKEGPMAVVVVELVELVELLVRETTNPTQKPIFHHSGR